MESKNKTEEIKNLVLNSKSPVVFKKCISNWPLLKFDLKNWSHKLGQKLLPVRIGNQKHYTQQWERLCTIRNIKFEDFLNEYYRSENKWAYFDYKYMHEWFGEDMDNVFDWGFFGFDSIKCRDSTLWMGTAGAHTPCHYDAYSCNLVAQIYGHKRWILVPPDDKKKHTSPMKPCRIPYEESSVYSNLDFYSPKDSMDFKDIKDAIVVTLEPGDVLLVPKHWWHFVENIDLAISINTWIPLESDNEDRLKEALARAFVGAFTQTPNFDKEKILNPNEDNLCQEDTSQTLGYLTQSVEKYLNENKNPTSDDFPKNEENLDQDIIQCQQIIQKYKDFIKILPVATKSEFKKIIQDNSKRYLLKAKESDSSEVKNENIVKCLINSFCNPHVMDLIKEIFVQEYNK